MNSAMSALSPKADKRADVSVCPLSAKSCQMRCRDHAGFRVKYHLALGNFSTHMTGHQIPAYICVLTRQDSHVRPPARGVAIARGISRPREVHDEGKVAK